MEIALLRRRSVAEELIEILHRETPRVVDCMEASLVVVCGAPAVFGLERHGPLMYTAAAAAAAAADFDSENNPDAYLSYTSRHWTRMIASINSAHSDLVQ